MTDDITDPVPRLRDTPHGPQVLTPGHAGTLYQACSAVYAGMTTPRTILLLPDATVLTARAAAKVTADERGARGVIARLVSLGAPAPVAGQPPKAWLAQALAAIGVRRLRHPGTHRYLIRVGAPAVRRRTYIALPQARPAHRGDPRRHRPSPQHREDPVTCDNVELITDRRYPRWRALLVHDPDAGPPWGDALAPALLLGPRQHAAFTQDVFQPADAARIVQACRYFADREVFCRYMRQMHGVTTIETVEDRDATVLVFDTVDYRAHCQISGRADLSGDRAEWQAWLDGDGYGVRIQARTRHGWADVDSCWGYLGRSYACWQAAVLLHETASSRPGLPVSDVLTGAR